MSQDEIFRPMLSAKLKKGQSFEDALPKLDWSRGLLCSPKLDGIRGICHPTKGLISRSGLKFPSRALNAYFAAIHDLVSGFDGEFIFGNHEDPNYSFQDTFSAVMSMDAPLTGLSYAVFDDMSFPAETHFQIRAASYTSRIINWSLRDNLQIPANIVPQVYARSVEDLLDLEEKCMNKGYEGVMMRDPYGTYKQGRSTWKQQGLMALKRFLDDEALVIGLEPRMRNDNEAETSATGYAKRSTHKDNKTALPQVGKLLVRGVPYSRFAGQEFSVPASITHALAQEWWENPEMIVGKIITYKYLPHGIKDAPRNLTFKSIRQLEDLPADQYEELRLFLSASIPVL